MQHIVEYARQLYPKEAIGLLRGKKKKEVITLTELILPPLATYGHGFSGFGLHMLPMDFSLVGTMHSHPSGSLTPSSADVNHFFGRILMIVGYPYANRTNAIAYDKDGKKLLLEISR